MNHRNSDVNGFNPQRAGKTRRAFTLVEIVVVLGIIAVLAAIILPVLGRVRESGRATVCKSNLHQLGLAMAQYTADYERYPRAADASDRVGIWNGQPLAAGVDFNTVPLLPQAMQAYVRDFNVWKCPSDFGFDTLEGSGEPMPARPSCYEAFGLSYFYRTELTLLDLSEEHLPDPVNTNVLFDAHGDWHGSGGTFGVGVYKRYNMLFADGHVKNVARDEYDEAWSARVK